MNRPNRAWRIFSIAIFPVLVALLAAAYLDDPYQYLNYLREDSLVEWLSFACLALSGLIALDIGIRTLRRERQFQWFFFAFGLFCLLMSFEEISWGQRLFSLTSPEYFLGNSDQQEINVHNVLQQKLDFKTKDLAALVLSVYGILLPLLALNRHIAALLKHFRLLVPPLYLIPGFLIATLLMFDVPTGFEEEIGEFLFGLCFLLFMIDELISRGMGVISDPERSVDTSRRALWATLDRLGILILTLMAFGLHLWQLDGMGLWLPEAIHAAAAQASPMEIVRHAWLSGAVEQPVLLLVLGLWQPMAGSSEFALRFLSALSVTAAVPIFWQTIRVFLPGQIVLRLFAALLLALAPAVQFYAQDASIYGPLVFLTALSLYLTVSICQKPSYLRLFLWLAVAWLLTASHIFSITIVAVEAIALAVVLFSNEQQIGRLQAGLILILALLPGLGWMLAAPGMQPALTSATTILDPDDWSRSIRMEQLWKDLTFGNALWQSYRSRLAIVLLPIFICGAAVLFLWRRIDRTGTLKLSPGLLTWLLLASVVIPMLLALFALPALPTATLLVALPALLAVCAIGAVYLLRAAPLVGAATMLLAVGLSVTGLVTYHSGVAKSGYREMATFVEENQQTGDGVLLAASSQHFLADYYLGDESVENVPQMQLSPYWPDPMSALVPHEVDGQIQSYLGDYPALWLALYDENSVDPGRFLPAYLTAVAYRDGCVEWDDVELCRFVSPPLLETTELELGRHLYAGELGLQNVSLATDGESIQGVPMLLAQLDWLAETQPSADYKVSLRLVDGNGEAMAQRDDFPIGPLLPPTVWGAGDQKSGFMALPLPEVIPNGRYALQVAVYNPADMQIAQYQTPTGQERSDPLTLAAIKIDEAGIAVATP